MKLYSGKQVLRISIIVAILAAGTTAFICNKNNSKSEQKAEKKPVSTETEINDEIQNPCKISIPMHNLGSMLVELYH